MYNQDDIKIREQKLMEAFTDEDFQKELRAVKEPIEELLNGFITWLKTVLSKNQRIYENIESRIKSADKFQEKIHRKDYILKWDVADTKSDNQKLIKTHLPDLIGFRINCFFSQDEEKIYELLKQYFSDEAKFNISLNYDENTTQMNGHDIYKVTGIYQEQYCFEVQIKSIMHNIWGEIEHQTIYKGVDYDPDLPNKKAITEEVFNILQASDKQLVTIFNKQTDTPRLIRGLFYQKTKKQVSEKSNTYILASHYNGFFKIFSDSENLELIKRFVACALLEGEIEYQPRKISVDAENAKINELSQIIKANFLEYNLKCVFYIASALYDIPDLNTFMLFLSGYLWKTYGVEDGGSDSDDAFDEDDEEQTAETVDYNELILNLLENMMGGRIKNDKN